MCHHFCCQKINILTLDYWFSLTDVHFCLHIMPILFYNHIYSLQISIQNMCKKNILLLPVDLFANIAFNLTNYTSICKTVDLYKAIELHLVLCPNEIYTTFWEHGQQEMSSREFDKWNWTLWPPCGMCLNLYRSEINHLEWT